MINLRNDTRSGEGAFLIFIKPSETTYLLIQIRNKTKEREKFK